MKSTPFMNVNAKKYHNLFADFSHLASFSMKRMNIYHLVILFQELTIWAPFVKAVQYII